MVIFAIFPLLFYAERWIICFTMKMFKFVKSCSTFSIIENFRCEKSRVVQKIQLVENQLYTA